jgi:putative hydrolase of the HAD superfamily
MSGYSPSSAQETPSPHADSERPDFRHVTHWVFDLDNTLYRADSGLFARIDARMTEFVAGYLGVEKDAARIVQKALYREHGTTLNGLIKMHGMDPEPYLEFVHQIDLSDLRPDGALSFAIERLPGRHHVFTNGCARHAGRVLARLGLTHLFHDVWDIRDLDFVPKPEASAYRRIVAHGGFAPEKAAMFDDIARNLVEAHALGMTTVWLNTDDVWARQGPEFPVASAQHIDHETKDLTHFLNSIRI